MAVLIAVLTTFIVLFEVSLVEINILSGISFLFILINLFYWFGRPRVAIISGVIASILIDLILQNYLGKTLFSLFAPMLVLTIFEGILKLEGKVSKIIFALVSTIAGIFIWEFLFKLVFFNGTISPSLILTKMIISGIFVIILSIIFSRFIPENTEKKSFLD